MAYSLKKLDVNKVNKCMNLRAPPFEPSGITEFTFKII